MKRALLAIIAVVATALPAQSLTSFKASADQLNDGTHVAVTWTDAGNEVKYVVRMDGEKLDVLPANTGRYVNDPGVGEHEYRIIAEAPNGNRRSAFASVEVVEPEPEPTPTPTPTPEPEPDCDVNVRGSIAAAAADAPQGATLCLSGTYEVPTAIRPKDGQSFVGPAVLVGTNGNDTGFDVKGPEAVGVTFVDLDMSGFTLRGIDCWVDTTVLGGRYHHNGRNGIGCGLNGLGGVVIDGVEVDHNGAPDELGAGSSGMKFARAHGVIVRDSFVHDNLGNGVWCDVQCGDYTVTDNTILRNSRKGVHYEKSGESDELVKYVGFATITGNVIRGNGWEGREHSDAGVAVISSKNVLIAGNTFGEQDKGWAVQVRQDGRLSGEKHGWVISNVTIRNNTLNGDRIIGCDLSGVTCE
jgi:hypothetical protein